MLQTAAPRFTRDRGRWRTGDQALRLPDACPLADPGSLLDRSVLAPIEAMVSRGGYGGVFVAILVENFLQFIASEAIMSLAGYLASQGKLALVPTILAGTLGTILGTFLWYLIGLYANEEKLEAAFSRLGVWFGVTSAKLKKSRHWFNRHGHLMVVWGRLVPVLRTLVSIPAGMELMPMRSFLLWTSLGSLIWNAFLTTTGYLLGEHWRVLHTWLKPVTALVVAGLVGALLYWLFTSRRAPAA